MTRKPQPGDIFRLEARCTVTEDLNEGLKFVNWRSTDLTKHLNIGETLTYIDTITCTVTQGPLYEFYASSNSKFCLLIKHFNRYALPNSNVNANPWWYLRRLT